MKNEDVIKEFRNAGALMDGHFILSSGLHSAMYLQCAKVLMDSNRAERLCKALANKIILELGENSIDLIVSPAMGGIIVGYELGRQMRIQSIFTEREKNQFTLRRGFSIKNNSRILVVEDIITTGKSSIECINCITSLGGIVVGVACLIDRSDSKNNIDFPMFPLAKLSIPVYNSNDLPESLKNIMPIKPGSRRLE